MDNVFKISVAILHLNRSANYCELEKALTFTRSFVVTTPTPQTGAAALQHLKECRHKVKSALLCSLENVTPRGGCPLFTEVQRKTKVQPEAITSSEYTVLFVLNSCCSLTCRTSVRVKIKHFYN